MSSHKSAGVNPVSENHANASNELTRNTHNEDTEINGNKAITSLCRQCSINTTKKSNSLECSKCHGLIHYECSKLPSYAIYSYKNSQRKYVCEICSPIPDNEYLWNEMPSKVIDNNDYQKIINDIYIWMKESSDTILKVDIPSFSEKIDIKYNNIEKTISRLENKYLEMEKSIDLKFQVWKLEAINKISSDCAEVSSNNNNSGMTQILNEKITAQDNQLDLLQSELSAKNKSIEQLSEQVKKVQIEIADKACCITVNKNENIFLKEKLTSVTEKENSSATQIKTLLDRIRLLTSDIYEKEAKIYTLQDDIRLLSEKAGRYEGENNKLTESINILRETLQHRQDSSPAIQESVDESNAPVAEDVLILHDSLFKYISEGVMKNENLVVKKEWTPRLADARAKIWALKSKPKVVLVHSGTNDLQHLGEDVIVQNVIDTYKMCNERGIKFIWSGITPRKDDMQINAKADLVNAMINFRLTGKDGATTSRHEYLYDKGIINESCFEDDIHVNEKKGSSLLAQNARASICRALEIEYSVDNKRVQKRNNENRNNNRSYQDRNNNYRNNERRFGFGNSWF